MGFLILHKAMEVALRMKISDSTIHICNLTVVGPSSEYLHPIGVNSTESFVVSH